MLFGAYATQVWWPAWNSTHPRSARTVKAKVNARILPVFGDLPLNQVDADQISRWTHTLAADGLSSSSIRTYRALLGLILNAAVTDGYLPHAPTLPEFVIMREQQPPRTIKSSGYTTDLATGDPIHAARPALTRTGHLSGLEHVRGGC